MLPEESVAIAFGVKLSRKYVEYVSAGNVTEVAASASPAESKNRAGNLGDFLGNTLISFLSPLGSFPRARGTLW